MRLLRRVKQVVKLINTLDPEVKEALQELILAIIPILDGKPPSPHERQDLQEALQDLQEALQDQ